VQGVKEAEEGREKCFTSEVEKSEKEDRKEERKRKNPFVAVSKRSWFKEEAET
jgi:hypothetical protein